MYFLQVINIAYKNKEMQKIYLRKWYEEHKEEKAWFNTLWREENRERKLALDKKSKDKNKHLYNCLKRLKRKLKNMSGNILYIEIVDIEQCEGCNREFFKKHHLQKYCTKRCATISRLLINNKKRR